MSLPGPRVAFALAAAVLMAATLESGPGPQARSAVACCFTNARYVGTCEVEPAKNQTCAAILDYLNNPQSQGKDYCNSTTIRGGWQQVPCEPKMKQD
jgi:hypothetical protein